MHMAARGPTISANSTAAAPRWPTDKNRQIAPVCLWSRSTPDCFILASVLNDKPVAILREGDPQPSETIDPFRLAPSGTTYCVEM